MTQQEFESRFLNRIICGDWIEAAKSIPTGIVQCIITSPPYWAQRDYGADGQLGRERTFQEHIEKLVIGFRELKRILRPDGILFVNYGDKYNAYHANVKRGGKLSGRNQHARPYIESGSGLSAKDLGNGNLLLLGARFAIAMQEDGWILRDAIVWAKAISSFGQHVCPYCGKELYQAIPQGNDLFGERIADEVVNYKKSGSTMPESINGTRWERCRVKIRKQSERITGSLEE